ncbi:hypothetical protein [Candidatus Cetobacterium colombiensis]|uniref:Uncharacterized protein n=1 Tax=Candidatus Cetobacterium colombiensis TaxID=3073100 RepID=A0ABU4W999_9FUSO|nr:hypothetical protein [Candidatus Cetobacterium colombiensis]MDX8335166.1 hypothetical protein [Candidatus Cetobacterium colombiensis]
MFFNNKNKELKKEIANLIAKNKEYEEKCEYYQEKYLQIKKEYVEALKKNENFNNAFRESFSELSSKLISVEMTLSKLEEKSKEIPKTQTLVKKFQEFEADLIKLSREINRLTLFLEKHTDFNKQTSTYQDNLEKSYRIFK